MQKSLSLQFVKTISLTGFMGSGKSSTGRELARILGLAFVDLDDVVVSREGRSIAEIFREGESAFRAAELSALSSLLDECEASGRPVVLALGGGTLTVDRARDEVLARTNCVYLRTRLSTIRERLGHADSSRPLFKDADRLYEEREPQYSTAHHTVDTDGLSPVETAGRIALFPFD